MNDQKNLLLAFVLSGAILFGWYIVFPPPSPQIVEEGLNEPVASADIPVPSPEGGVAASAPSSSQDAGQDSLQDAAPAPRLAITSSELTGSLSARGLRLDDLLLPSYQETPAPSSAPIRLLEPVGGLNPYTVDIGWVGSGLETPGPQALWQRLSGDETLAPGQPATWQWQAPDGITYTTKMTIDDHYLLTYDLAIHNTTSSFVSVTPYGRIARYRTPETLGYFILHEGPYGVFNDTLAEYSYDDLQDEAVTQTSRGGWLGFTDKYWLVALAPEPTTEVKSQFLHRPDEVYKDRYLALLQTASPLQVAPGERTQVRFRIFVGAKRVSLTNAYTELITGFDRTIDFGWFFFLTKPFFYALDWINQLVGNFGVAILLFTVVIKLVLFPLANKSYRSMSRMKLLQPQILELRERYGEDRTKLNQEMMELYKREKVNPVSGCLPIVLQIPVFFALYKVLFVTIEMRHAPFFGWIQDLSAPDPTSLFNAFGLLPFTPPTFLMIGVWPLLMGLTMFAQQKLNPPPADPIQQKIFTFLPIFFTFLLAGFPAGLVIYWTWNNLLSIVQQAVIMHQVGAFPATRSGSPDAPKVADKSADKKVDKKANEGADTPDEKKDDAIGPVGQKPLSKKAAKKAAKKAGKKRRGGS